jgi:predicted flap endonuclease-1-like 5' DNA nuclease
MAGKQTDTFPYDLNDQELDKLFNIATKRPEVVERFETPVRLTSEENEPVLWAVGRSQSGELMVESRYDDEIYPARPFGSFVTHAEELAIEAMRSSDYKALQEIKITSNKSFSLKNHTKRNLSKRMWLINIINIFRLPTASNLAVKDMSPVKINKASDEINTPETHLTPPYTGKSYGTVIGFIVSIFGSFGIIEKANSSAKKSPKRITIEYGKDKIIVKNMICELENIKGLSLDDAIKLKNAGITNTFVLLEQGSTQAERFALAKATKISEELILKWVSRIELSRVNGITRQISDLLEATGIDTIVELASRVPANLTMKLAEVNESGKIAERNPTLAEVEDWIDQAKELPRIVHY